MIHCSSSSSSSFLKGQETFATLHSSVLCFQKLKLCNSFSVNVLEKIQEKESLKSSSTFFLQPHWLETTLMDKKERDNTERGKKKNLSFNLQVVSEVEDDPFHARGCTNYLHCSATCRTDDERVRPSFRLPSIIPWLVFLPSLLSLLTLILLLSSPLFVCPPSSPRPSLLNRCSLTRQ